MLKAMASQKKLTQKENFLLKTPSFSREAGCFLMPELF